MKQQCLKKTLKIGLVLGIIAGLVSGFIVSDIRMYYDYGMYKTIFYVLARSLNYSVLFFMLYSAVLCILGLLCARLRGTLRVLFGVVTGMSLVAGFPKASALLHAPFAYNPQLPWEVVDPMLFKTAWISLGVAAVLSLWLVRIILRVGSERDETDYQIGPSGRESRYGCGRSLTLPGAATLVYACLPFVSC